MSYEIKTPVLNEAVDMARSAYRGVMTKTLEAREAGAVNGSAGRLISAVSTDVRARLAEHRLREMDAEQAMPPKKRKHRSARRKR